MRWEAMGLDINCHCNTASFRQEALLWFNNLESRLFLIEG